MLFAFFVFGPLGMARLFDFGRHDTGKRTTGPALERVGGQRRSHACRNLPVPLRPAGSAPQAIAAPAPMRNNYGPALIPAG